MVGILITGILKQSIKDSKVIVHRITEIIDPGRVKSCKMVVKVVNNEFTLFEQLIILWQHVTTIDYNICLKVFCPLLGGAGSCHHDVFHESRIRVK